ncbi:MAG: hypothetical protein R2771_05510 [Saprospiraceae bacterium]
MGCLLVEHKGRIILVDTGMGDKQDAKFRGHFHPRRMKVVQSIRKGFEQEPKLQMYL